jgi:argininosuccinate synthase
MKRIVLAYSSALERVSDSRPISDSGARSAIAWLADQHGAEIVTLTLDFGQGRALESLRDRALADGAVRAHVLDVAGVFSSSFVLPALRAGALYADGRSMTTGLGRALIAQKLVEVAGIEQTTVVAHGGVPEDRRIAAAIASLDARVNVLAIPPSAARGGESWNGPRMIVHGETPSESASVEVAFVRGVPTAINGVPMPLPDLIGSLDMLAGLHRVGRFDHLETPAMFVLHTAHAGLQASVDGDMSERRAIARRYVELIDGGSWFTPERQALDATIGRLEESVSGSVRAELLRGECRLEAGVRE